MDEYGCGAPSLPIKIAIVVGQTNVFFYINVGKAYLLIEDTLKWEEGIIARIMGFAKKWPFPS